MDTIDFEKRYKKELDVNDNLKNQVINLKSQLMKFNNNSQLDILNKQIELNNLKWSRCCLGLNKEDFIYMIYERRISKKVVSLMGYVSKETLNHIKVLVHDKKNNIVFSYYINKESIIDIKHYNNRNNNYICFEELTNIKNKMKGGE